MTDREELINRSIEGMTIKEMLLRLDARMDRFEPRMRSIEDEQLTARVERRTVLAVFASLRSTILVAAAAGPIVAGIIAFSAFITQHPNPQ